MVMNKNIKILIVEDEVLIAGFIEETLNDSNYLNTKISYNYEDALSEMHHFSPDIILMDINLNGHQTGIELSVNKNLNASVIFLTGQHDSITMHKALSTTPDSYLTKPIKRADLFAAINLAVLKKESLTFTFKDGHNTVYLNYNEILYVNADGNYLQIHTDTKKYTIRRSLTDILKDLPDAIFKQIHRSYVVNSHKITRKSKGKIFLGNIELPLSRKHDKVFLNTD